MTLEDKIREIVSEEICCLIFPQSKDTSLTNFSMNSNGFITYDIVDIVSGNVLSSVTTGLSLTGLDSYASSTIVSTVTLTNVTMKNFNKVSDEGVSLIEITLPLPSTLGIPANFSDCFTFKRINTGYPTVIGGIKLKAPAGSKIDEGDEYMFAANDFASVTLWSDGTKYWIK